MQISYLYFSYNNFDVKGIYIMQKLSTVELKEKQPIWKQQYQEFKTRNLNLDLTRGKPCPEQLDLALGMLDCVNSKDYLTIDGLDCRNYGGIDGIPEAKALFAEYMEVFPAELIIGGNSSLNMMYDIFIKAMAIGIMPGEKPWGQLPGVKILCPSPGYDRHFSICSSLGIQMILINYTDQGPDMDQVEKLVAKDEMIKGIWCVPKYSNPTGVTYSDEVVERLAAMPVKAKDFRIFWDNAYAVHHLTNSPSPLKNILTACKQAGNAERVLLFGSTSKISFAGAGIAMLAGSEKNIDFIKSQISFQSIGPDKLNQLRHVRFFKNMAGINSHMQKHRAILKPKFDTVQEILVQELTGKNIAIWTCPQGGYFISLDTLPGCAGRVIKLAGDAGVKLTPAGSTYPGKKDSQDKNIRIAPSFASLEDIKQAVQLLTLCVQLATLEMIQ